MTYINSVKEDDLLKASIANRKWNWLDAFLFFVRSIWIFFNSSAILELFSGQSTKSFLFLWLFAVYLGPHLFYRPGFINSYFYLAAEVVLTGSLFVFLINQFQLVDIYDFMYFPFISIAYVCQVRPLIWLGPVISAGVFILGMFLGNLASYKFYLALMLTAAIFYGIGFVLGRVIEINEKRRILMESIQEKNLRLEQYSNRIEELTVIEERNRLSRDVHKTVDVVFSSMIENLEKLPALLSGNQEAEVEALIKETSTLTRAGLNDVRKTIHQLSPIEDVKSLTESLCDIVEEFIEQTDTEMAFSIDGTERTVGERAKLILIRCLQESLTNAITYRQASRIGVKLFFKEDYVLLQVQDNGIGSNNINMGFGLEALKNRITALRGTLKVESEPAQGMKVSCAIPLGKEEMIKP